MDNYLVIGTNPDDPSEYDEDNDSGLDSDGAFDDEPDYDDWEDDVWEEDFPTGRTEQIDNDGGW